MGPMQYYGAASQHNPSRGKPHGVTFPHPVSEGPFSLRTNLHEFVASTRTASQLSMKRKGPDDDGAARLLLHLSDGGDAPQHSATTMASDKAGFEDFDLAPCFTYCMSRCASSTRLERWREMPF